MVSGRKGLVVGVANERSLAWGIARALHREGAQLALTYQGDVFAKRVRPLAEQLDAGAVPCDVTDAAQVRQAVDGAAETLGGLDMLVHAVAFADRAALQGPYMEVSRQAFLRCLEVSVYSLALLCRHALPHMSAGGAVVTLTYLGAERAIPGYNVMGVAKAALESSVRYLATDLGAHGVRINAISAGPVKTLSASGVSQFSRVLGHVAGKAALGRNIDALEVGRAGLFLLSDLSSGTTGEILHVDAGYSIVGT